MICDLYASINDTLQVLPYENCKRSSRTTRATRVDQDRSSITWIVNRHLCRELCDSNADSLVWVCVVVVIKWYAQLRTLKVVVTFVELKGFRCFNLSSGQSHQSRAKKRVFVRECVWRDDKETSCSETTNTSMDV